MNYKELDKLLNVQTTAEKDILKKLDYYKYEPLNDDDKLKILSNILNTGEERNLISLTDDSALLPNENLTISKHHRFIDIPYHKHNFIELCYVYSGSCTQTINDSEIILKTGDLFMLDTNVIHSIKKANECDIFINFLMRKEYFDSALLSRLSSNDLISNFLVHAIYESKKYNNYIVFRSNNNNKLRSLILDLMCSYYNNSLCFNEVINCYMILIFAELLNIHLNQNDNMYILDRKNPDKNITDILKYIETNYKTVSLASLSKEFNFHPNYLSSLIKKLTGKSFKTMVNEQKLKNSALLLENTSMTIENIAFEIGYSNLNFFYRKFKDEFGTTPQKYRNEKKK